MKKVIEFENKEQYLNLIKDLVHIAKEHYAELPTPQEDPEAFPILLAADILLQAEDVEVKIK